MPSCLPIRPSFSSIELAREFMQVAVIRNWISGSHSLRLSQFVLESSRSEMVSVDVGGSRSLQTIKLPLMDFI